MLIASHRTAHTCLHMYTAPYSARAHCYLPGVDKNLSDYQSLNPYCFYIYFQKREACCVQIYIQKKESCISVHTLARYGECQYMYVLFQCIFKKGVCCISLHIHTCSTFQYTQRPVLLHFAPCVCVHFCLDHSAASPPRPSWLTLLLCVR